MKRLILFLMASVSLLVSFLPVGAAGEDPFYQGVYQFEDYVAGGRITWSGTWTTISTLGPYVVRNSSDTAAYANFHLSGDFLVVYHTVYASDTAGTYEITSSLGSTSYSLGDASIPAVLQFADVYALAGQETSLSVRINVDSTTALRLDYFMVLNVGPDSTPVGTATAVPTATPPNTPVPTATILPSSTPGVPTATILPSSTPGVPTATILPSSTPANTPVDTPTEIVFLPTPTEIVFPATPTEINTPVDTPTEIVFPATPTEIVFLPTPTEIVFPATPTEITTPVDTPTEITFPPTPTEINTPVDTPTAINIDPTIEFMLTLIAGGPTPNPNTPTPSYTPSVTNTPTPEPRSCATLPVSGQLACFDYIATASDVHIGNLLALIFFSVWGFFLFAVLVLWRRSQ